MLFFCSLFEDTTFSSIISRGAIPPKFFIPWFILSVQQVEVCTHTHCYMHISYFSNHVHVACAGMLTLSVCNPIWVVKTRLCLSNTASVPAHNRYSGLADGLYKLYRYEGRRGLYRGFVPGLWGTSHGAIQFMFYEQLKIQYALQNSTSIDAKLVCMVLWDQ